MSDPVGFPAREAAAASSATQLSILLDATRNVMDEEFKRSERLDSKSRNQVGVTATFFAVVQAGVISLIGGRLGSSVTATWSIDWFLPVAAALAAIAMLVAVLVSYGSWKLRDEDALDIETIRAYVAYARAGDPLVGVKLIEAFAHIAEDRREKNEMRATALSHAVVACGATIALATVQLVVAFGTVAFA